MTLNSITLKLSSKEIQTLKDFYQHDLVEPVPYSVFRAKITGVNITAYESGKVLFQGKGTQTELEELTKVFPFIKLPQINKPTELNQGNLIGSDEVGNGSYFGALTVCAVYLQSNQVELVRELGAKDSKHLTNDQIRKLAWELKQVVTFHLTVCDPEDYNRVIGKKHNAVSIKVSLHNHTLQRLLEKLTDTQRQGLKGIIIDEFTSPINYRKYLSQEPQPYDGDLTFHQKAESQYLAVACASIIARDAFLSSLEDLGKDYGIKKLPSGASPNVDRLGREYVRKYGSEFLQKTAKYHFKNTEKILG